MGADMKRPGKIIVVSVDTLRADRLGCYGYGRPTTPNLDRLAAEGARYPYVFTACPYTVPTHTSMLTGIYPSGHGIGFSQKSGGVDPDSTVFLQEMLRCEGYATAGFVSAFVLRKSWGLGWGFDVYDDTMTRAEPNRANELIRDGMETTRAALGWIRENRADDLFVFLHYFDVHGPYASDSAANGAFRPEDYGDAPVPLKVVLDGQPGGIPAYQLLDAVRDESGEVTGYQDDLRRYLAGYDNGVRYADSVIGALVDGLKEEGVYDDSLIVVTSDHGEALGEGGVYFFHGLTVSPEQTRVPLIIKPPRGTENPPASDGPFSTVDIMPTVLDFAGVTHGGLGLDGVSLFAGRPGRTVVSENEWQRAAARDGYYCMVEKDVVYDGFEYYFNSQRLCRGTRLLDYRTGEDLPLDAGGPAGALLEYAGLLGRVTGPMERRIRRKDSELDEVRRSLSEKSRAVAEKDIALAGKDMVIASKDAVIARKDSAIAGRDSAIAYKDAAIAGKDRTIAVQAGRISAGQEELRACRGRVASLEGEIAGVYASKSWRLTYPLRWVSVRLKGHNG